MGAVALGRDFEFKVDRPEGCPTGLAEVDAMAGGLPQGCLTEVYGPASSGRTSLMLAAMAHFTGRPWQYMALKQIRTVLLVALLRVGVFLATAIPS